MEKYHKYVFDIPNRKFVGNFEEMYQNESKENFDSWHQDDTRQFHRQVALLLLNRYNFNTVLDIGCGKGAFTHQLKKDNNRVHGTDISSTAIKIASEKFPDIDFSQADINNADELKKLFLNTGDTELILLMEILSYCSNWKQIIETSSKYSKYILTSLFIPANPIGFVKTHDELIKELEKHFSTIEIVSLNKVPFTIYFGKSKEKNN